MSILGRIEVALAIHEGNKQFRKELRANNREAGAKKNHKTGESFDNSTNKQQEKPINSTPVNETPNTLKEKNTSVKKKEKKNPPKTEQQINAEAEAPAEPAGAEQPAMKKSVPDIPMASMSTPVHIEEPQRGVLNMNGVLINTKDVMQRPDVSQQRNPINPAFNGAGVPIIHNQQGNPIPMNPPQQANPINPAFNTAGVPMIPQNMGFNINPMPGMDVYAQRMAPQQPFPGMGNHKVDKPEVKPAKLVKSPPDNVNMEGMPNPGDAMEVQKFKVIDARTHGILEDKISKEVEKVELKSVFPTNVNLYKEYPYLEEIEKIALDNGYQVGFTKTPVGLIHCHIANADGKYIDNKGFTVDPGLIIDQRKKVFPGIACFYEGMNAYPLFINAGGSKDKKEKKSSSNVFNEELIKGLIIGGNDNVSSAKGMYTEDYRNLNAIVALITIPTHKNSPADRKYIQNRLVDLYKSGIFNEALIINPNTRFRVAEYDSNTGTIILDNYMVFKNFGGQYYNGERIQFKITKDKCKMLRGENLVQVSM